MKKLIAMVLCCSIVSSMSSYVYAQSPDTTQPPPGIVLYEGEVWIPASDSDGIMPLEMENADCGKTTHLAPKGYRYIGCKQGDTRVENVQGTVGGFLVTLIVPDLGLLVGLIGIGIAVDQLDGEVSGTYMEYIWSDSFGNRWSHVIGYASYTVNGVEHHKYVNCETKP